MLLCCSEAAGERLESCSSEVECSVGERNASLVGSGSTLTCSYRDGWEESAREGRLRWLRWLGR